MFWTKVKGAAMAMAIAVAFLSLGGLGLAAQAYYRTAEGEEQGKAIAQASSAGAQLADADEPQDDRDDPKASPEEARLRMQSMNNLKQILLAMHNYEGAHRHFPAPAIYDQGGKALLSWRVELLPFLEQQELYKQFRRDESWDSPHNRALAERMPDVFALPGAKKGNVTHYQVFVGPGAAFEKHKGRRISEFIDGTSNTILVVEAASAVPWTKPEDLAYDPDGPLPELGGTFPKAFNVGTADGSVHAARNEYDKEEFRKLITCNGGEIVDEARVFGDVTPNARNAHRVQEAREQASDFQSLRDEVQALRAELRRLKDRVQRLENGR